jgi:hypothetical protein
LTEANEVLETGTKLNAHYKANSNLTLLLGYQVNETGMLNQTTVSAPSYSTKRRIAQSCRIYGRNTTKATAI